MTELAGRAATTEAPRAPARAITPPCAVCERPDVCGHACPYDEGLAVQGESEARHVNGTLGPPRGPIYCDGEEAWQPGCGWCATCGVALEPVPIFHTRRPPDWFCSTACAKTWRVNHQWGLARAAALKRDRRCVRCGSSGGKVEHRDPRDRGLEVNHKRPLVEHDGRVGHARSIAGTVGRSKYVTGCAQHLDNLETLCKPCHRETTAEQARARARGRAEATA